jgi:hypothetical protein
MRPILTTLLTIGVLATGGGAVVGQEPGPRLVCVEVSSSLPIEVLTGSPGALGEAVVLGQASIAVVDLGECTAGDEPLDGDDATTATADPTPAPGSRPRTYARLAKRAWQKLVKSPDRSTGRGYVVWGCITQFDAATGADSFRAQASHRRERYWYTNGVNAYFVGTEPQLDDVVEDDIVRMDVISLGSFSYDTQIGGSTTVPLFEVVRIRRERGSC